MIRKTNLGINNHNLSDMYMRWSGRRSMVYLVVDVLKANIRARGNSGGKSGRPCLMTVISNLVSA
jgi:hypothetical protein